MPDIGIQVAGILLHASPHLFTEGGVIPIAATKSNNFQALGQALFSIGVEQGRQQFAAGQVAGSAENHNCGSVVVGHGSSCGWGAVATGT
ncbi:MAG: hypothetical protein WBG37_13350 [Desulfobacterales bacterium]